MSRKKVIVFTTGGTIAMKFDPVKGVVPAVSGEDLVAAVPGLDKVCDVEVREFANIPSPHMTPELMFDLSAMIRKALAEPDVAGAVVTHGTDTVEETSYFLDLTIDSDKPVCLTAAMRSAAEISPDGPKNILCAVKAAAADATRGIGSVVVLNEEIHAAREVMKTHSANPATFQSPWWGPIGYVDEDRVILRRAPLDRQHILPASLHGPVDVIKMMTGSDSAYIDFAIGRGARGIVIEGFGRGNLPVGSMAGIERAIKAGIPVVLTTRTPGGRVLDVYGYPGGVKTTKAMGIILGGELSAAKARLKLLLLVSRHPDQKPDRDELQSWFDE